MLFRQTMKFSVYATVWACILSVPGLAQPPAATARAPTPLIPDAAPVRSCESLTSVALPDTTIESGIVDGNICRVTAIRTNPATDERITVWTAIPMTGWNGRFLGTGGGGYLGGAEARLMPAVTIGFAAGATDTGHAGGEASFALQDDGRLNWQSIRNFSHVGIHEMTATGKALTEALYGEPPRYAYFNGCSTGGRQGLMEAQRYPDDYDGIIAAAPAINWPSFLMADLWPAVIMNTEDHIVPVCKLRAATAVAVASCDLIDGVEDGVLADPTRCYYDPHELVGNEYDCGTFTAEDADIVQALWLGPRRQDERFLWYGLPPGADLAALGGSAGDPLTPRPFPIPVDWVRYFLMQDPDFDWTTLTRADYELLWDQSVEQYSRVIGTDYPNLTNFRDNGGKLIMWHGWSDPLITAYGSTNYYDRVAITMGGEREAEKFIRLFMAPGVAHCAGGIGPNPTAGGLMDAIISWVEEGTEPESLPAELRDAAGELVRSRPLCVFPQVASYRGRGSTDDAENFECRDRF